MLWKNVRLCYCFMAKNTIIKINRRVDMEKYLLKKLKDKGFLRFVKYIVLTNWEEKYKHSNRKWDLDN